MRGVRCRADYRAGTRSVGRPTRAINSVIPSGGSVPPFMCIKVLLADDTAFMRNAIRSLLGREPEIELVGEAQNFAESLSLTRQFKPHVVILDLHMPDSLNLTPMNVSERPT